MPFYDRQKVQDAASGRWLELLAYLSVPDLSEALNHLDRKHVTCPVHGTSNRGGRGDGFRFYKDVAVSGGGVCNSCGSFPNGFEMLSFLNGNSFKDNLAAVAELLGVKPEPPQNNQGNNRPQKSRKPKPYRAKASQPAKTGATASQQVVIAKKVANGSEVSGGTFWGSEAAQQAVAGQPVQVRGHSAKVAQAATAVTEYEPPMASSSQPAPAEKKGNVVPLDRLRDDPRMREIRKAQESLRARTQLESVEITKKVKKVWRESVPLQSAEAFPVMKYFSNRKLTLRGSLYSSDTLRAHPALEYYEVDDEDNVKLVGKFPTLIASIRDPQGEIATLHRIYLTARGVKATVESPKKMMPVAHDACVTGGAIRLGGIPEDGVLGIAEGIETALACTKATGFTVWSAISATILEGFQPPPGIHTVLIWADKDRSLAGERSAIVLKDRLVAMGIRVLIMLPRQPIKATDKGVDWVDVLRDQGVLGFPRRQHLLRCIYPQPDKPEQSDSEGNGVEVESEKTVEEGK